MKKNVCKKGHPLTPENSYVKKSGTRHCMKCHKVREKEYNRQRRLAGKRNVGLRLDAGPFAEWLRENQPGVLRESSLAFMNDYRPRDFQSWAKSHGIDPTQARRLIRGENGTVHYDIVDRVLTEAGVPWMFSELYPPKEEVA
jgi:nicotinic acid phosphoribosyltransferase